MLQDPCANSVAGTHEEGKSLIAEEHDDLRALLRHIKNPPPSEYSDSRAC